MADKNQRTLEKTPPRVGHGSGGIYWKRILTEALSAQPAAQVRALTH